MKQNRTDQSVLRKAKSGVLLVSSDEVSQAAANSVVHAPSQERAGLVGKDATGTKGHSKKRLSDSFAGTEEKSTVDEFGIWALGILAIDQLNRLAENSSHDDHPTFDHE